MKKVLAGMALAALVFAAAGFAYSARPTTATPTAVTPTQFRALQKRVVKLEKLTNALAVYTAGCLLKWQGVARFGQPPNSGYLYDNDSDPANGHFLSSALDITDTGETPTAYFVVTQDQNCLPSGLALRRNLRSLHAMAAPKALSLLRVRMAITPYGDK